MRKEGREREREKGGKEFTVKDTHTRTHQLARTMQPLRPYEKQDTLRQFLDYDRQVLRFNCFWDDTDRSAGRLSNISNVI